MESGEPTQTLHQLTGWALLPAARRRSSTTHRSTQPTLEEIYLNLTATAQPDPRWKGPRGDIATRPSSRRGPGLVWHQVRYEQLSFWRNPQSAFFTFVFPVVIITIFGALFRGGSGSSYFYGLSALKYYVPTIAASRC